MTDKFLENSESDAKVHQGHRCRMRAKLECHGQRIFDTYELLEMLLYYTIPYKDTNPIAKRLLSRFETLDGVFSADVNDLVSVNGIGTKTAEMIVTVGKLSSILGAEPEIKNDRFSNHCKVGRFLVSYFKDETEKKILALYFDNSMKLISLEEVFSGIDYDSAAVIPKPFLDRAMQLGAVAVITAHNHPFGSPYPTSGDRVTNQLLRMELSKVKVTLAEHYVISGDRYTSTGDEFIINYSESSLLEDFIKSRNTLNNPITVADIQNEESYYNTEDLDYFSDLLSYVERKEPKQTAEKLMKRFSTIENTLTVSSDLVEVISNKTIALYLKLVAYLISRKRTDAFTFKRPHNTAEIAEYFKAIFIGVPVENVYLMCLDQKGRPILCERVSEGIVNSAEILPRRLLEIAVKCSARQVILAHNHPLGKPTPSSEDLYLTSNVYNLFRSTGIVLTHHFVISGQRCETVKYDENEMNFIK